MLFLLYLQGHYGIRAAWLLSEGLNRFRFSSQSEGFSFQERTDEFSQLFLKPNCSSNHPINHRFMRQDDFTLETKIIGLYVLSMMTTSFLFLSPRTVGV